MSKFGFFIKTVIVFGAMISQSASAEDLFSDNLSRDYKPVKVLANDTTIGGYTIYQGGRTWQVSSGESSLIRTFFRAGGVVLVSPMDNRFFMQTNLTVNLSNGRGYFTADICSGSHLVAINHGGLNRDNCMTINPQSVKVGEEQMTVLVIHIRNAQANLRLYDVIYHLNLDQLGFTQTALTDWTPDTLAHDPEKKKLLEKVTAWAGKLQDGVDKAISYDKPQNAFDAVPPIKDLLPVLHKTEPVVQSKL